MATPVPNRITTNPRRMSLGRIVDLSREAVSSPQSFRQVKANDMQVDHGYQRHVLPTHVASIAANFDPLLFGVILLSERTDGSYWILDGQQRVTAILQLGMGDEPLPCEILTGLSWADESRIYDMRNKNRKPLTPQDKFKGALAWGEPDAVSIARIVRDAGFTINLENSDRVDGQIPAVGSLRSVRRQVGSEGLRQSLAVIAKAWGTDVGPRGPLIDGIAYFLHLYRDRMDPKRYIATLRKSTMEQWVAEAKEYRRATGALVEVSYAARMVQVYNYKLHQANMLPSIEEMRLLNAVKEANDGR